MNNLKTQNKIIEILSNTICDKGTEMNISENGLKFIFDKEGCKLIRYTDVGGLPTIGVGHLINGREIPPIGNFITKERAMQLLYDDVQKIVDEFNNHDDFADLPKCTQSEFDACVSLAFNIGITAFDESTVLKKMEGNDLIGAANAFLLWDKVGSKVIQGLVNRRNAERELFLKGDF